MGYLDIIMKAETDGLDTEAEVVEYAVDVTVLGLDATRLVCYGCVVGPARSNRSRFYERFWTKC